MAMSMSLWRLSRTATAAGGTANRHGVTTRMLATKPGGKNNRDAPPRRSSSFQQQQQRHSKLSSQQVPRRLIVKRKPSVHTQNPQQLQQQQQQQQQQPLPLQDRIGTIIPSKNSNSNTTANNKFLKPPPPKQDGNNNDIRLPILNASALLDRLQYCRSSANAATSTSGTEAMRRLLKGKKEFIHVIQQHLRRTQTASSSSSSFLLEGHGVPPQLLQHCINQASGLLESHQAQAIAFHHSILQVPTWMRVRTFNPNNHRNQARQIPVACLPDMELYLAVMHRWVTALGTVFTNTATTPYHIWNVEYQHARSMPLSGTNNTTNTRSPRVVVEWSLPSLHKGHVTIQLQGYPDSKQGESRDATGSPTTTTTTTTLRRKRRRSLLQPVTMTFDACFVY